MVVDVHARNHEIVPGLLQRKEFQAEQLRRRANAEPHIGMSLGNRSCHLKMGAGDGCVPGDTLGSHTGRNELLIEEKPGTGAGFTIDESNLRSYQILNATHRFGIPGSCQEPLFPHRKGDHEIVVPFQVAAQIGQVRLSGLRIHNVHARNVHLSPLERFNCRGTAEIPSLRPAKSRHGSACPPRTNLR